jgi:hypothetical protein
MAKILRRQLANQNTTQNTMGMLRDMGTRHRIDEEDAGDTSGSRRLNSDHEAGREIVAAEADRSEDLSNTQ